MIIKFKNKKNKKKLTYADVEENQFFVCDEGFLCQKVDADSYNVIANPVGEPYADQQLCAPSQPIERILPNVDKIEF